MHPGIVTESAVQNTEKASFTALVNLFLFQSVWFLSVLGAANGNGWVGAVGLGVFFVLHYLFAHTAAADLR